ncbi:MULTISPECIES: hypothetical protein [Saccharothrix]|uniref:hypothetical protein n=1 Tax=Saccharothrix TaxID=2071 RepID=UPI000939D944|nr:hypothetical protein [Saccharothrix sp. CB00851]
MRVTEVVFAELVHLVLTALWLGSMVYSLVVVQPRVARFFPDDGRREEFLLALANGNRWPVVALIAGIVLTGGTVAITGDGAVSAGYTVAVVLDLVAAVVFADVSWRHWPARVFALPEELPGFRRGLTVRTVTMTVLVGASFVVALAVSLR